MHRLLFLDPGHFHAALTLRAANPRVADEIHLHAPEGAESQAFVDLVEGFNARADAPTAWRLECHLGANSLHRLIEERRGEIVILAGRNDRKLATIRRLREAGFHVLADKPWLTGAGALGDLAAATTPGRPLAMDIMTSRHMVLARLRRALVGQSELFGAFEAGGPEPAIEQTSRHHIHKLVNGQPLRRPDWYFDCRVQGDGLVDIQSHLLDQAQWLIATLHGPEAERDIEVIRARRWPTPVGRELYAESTGVEDYPELPAGVVVDDVIQLACNGVIEFSIGGVRVRQRAEWGAREAEGGGDQQHAVARGSGAQLVLRQGPETNHAAELHVASSGARDLEPRLAAAVAALAADFPGLSMAPSELGFRLTVAPGLDGGHESHFPLVLDEFLDLLDGSGDGAALAARIGARYALLARAQAIAEDVPPPPDAP